MQHLDNDMDDLFQRAAENYPLKNNADWESVASKMEAATNSNEAVAPVKNKKDKKIILLLLLLLLLSGAWLTWHTLFTRNSTGNKNVSLANKPQPEQTGSVPQNNVTSSSAGKKTPAFASSKNLNKKKKSIIYSSTNITTSAGNPSFVYSNKTSGKKITKNKIGNDANDGNSVSENNSLKESSDNNPSEKNENNIDTIAQQAVKEDNQLKQQEEKKPGVDAKKNNKKTAAKKKAKGFYAGLVAGPDFSKVESVSFGNTGFDGGFILGYTFNPQLSIETGLIANNKNYNSTGKDFNMDKIGPSMPSGMTINNVNSHSSLMEIPIKAKYNFIGRANANFFVSGGASAYIMTKEKNMYDGMVNGTHEKIMGVYNKASYGLPAVANISIGYEHKILKLLNVRVEPFLKIPLKGMGVGSLPVTSAGLQIGITSHLK